MVDLLSYGDSPHGPLVIKVRLAGQLAHPQNILHGSAQDMGSKQGASRTFESKKINPFPPGVLKASKHWMGAPLIRMR